MLALVFVRGGICFLEAVPDLAAHHAPVHVDDFTEVDLAPIRELEAFLNKNKQNMTQIGRGRYTVSDSEFDAIFPPCLMNARGFNYAVGLIENSFVDPVSGLNTGNSGTGVVIQNDVDTIRVMTARHVVENPGTIMFTLGSAGVMPRSRLITFLAKYVSNGILVHPDQDVAILECRLLERSTDDDDILRGAVMRRDHTPVQGNLRRKVTMNHYPYGVEAQRMNEGQIILGGVNHTIPTLGGSSGAPIIYGGNIVGIHSGGHEFRGGVAEFDARNRRIARHNYYVRLADINPDLTEFERL